MNPLTLTALVFWTFQPFNELQDANRFMDSLPATACAVLNYGQASTTLELELDRQKNIEMEREEKAQQRKYAECLEKLAKDKKDNDAWSTLPCGQNPAWGFMMGVRRNTRWIVSYKAEGPELERRAMDDYARCTTTAKANGTLFHGSACRSLLENLWTDMSWSEVKDTR